MNLLPSQFLPAFRALCIVTVLASAATAQTLAVPKADILVIDTGRLVSASQFGRELRADLEKRQEQLSEEDAALDEALMQEELELTEKRSNLSASEFSALADAFDQKAQETRIAQAEKYAALERENNQIALTIYSMAKPIFAEIMNEAEALVLIDQSSTILSAGHINITDIAIERIDNALRTQ